MMKKIGNDNTVAPASRGWHLVRVIAAMVLFVAAATKCHQCCTGPIPGTGLFSAKWFVIGLVEAEWLGSVVLLLCLLPKSAWAISLACFSAFTLVSLGKGLMGEASCGCFGRLIQVNPFLTATLDLALVVSLLRWRPKQSFFSIRRALAVLTIWTLIGIPAAYAMSVYTPATLADSGEIVGNGKVVVLKPETWIGKDFPLLHYTSIGEELKGGKWLVLLYRAECPKCQKMIQGLPQLVRAFDVEQVALIEMPPYGNPNDLLRSVGLTVVYGFLDNREEWVAETPHAILLTEGIVLKTWQGVIRSDHVAYNQPSRFGLRSFRVE